GAGRARPRSAVSSGRLLDRDGHGGTGGKATADAVRGVHPRARRRVHRLALPPRPLPSATPATIDRLTPPVGASPGTQPATGGHSWRGSEVSGRVIPAREEVVRPRPLRGAGTYGDGPVSRCDRGVRSARRSRRRRFDRIVAAHVRRDSLHA